MQKIVNLKKNDFSWVFHREGHIYIKNNKNIYIYIYIYYIYIYKE